MYPYSYQPYVYQNDVERQFNLPSYLFGQFFGGPPFGPSSYFPPGGSFEFPGYGGGWPPNLGGTGGTEPQQSGPPTSPPPNFTPQQAPVQTFAIDPGAIRGCLFRFTYVWLRNEQFWFYPTFVGRNSIAGFRWRRNRWVYFGIDLEHIQSFQCF